MRRFATRPKYEPIYIKEELSSAELAFVEAHRGRDAFPEMELIQSQQRVYPRMASWPTCSDTSVKSTSPS